MNPAMEELCRAVAEGDGLRIKEIVDRYTEDKTYVALTCRGCGAVVAFESQKNWLRAALLQESAQFKYLVLKHVSECPQHDVIIPVAGLEIHASQILEQNIRHVYEQNGRDYASDLPNIVERWRLKCVGKP